MRLKEGQAFAGFTIVRKLGRGGMASVYLATEPGFARQIALKVLPEDLADEPSFVARFQQEAQTIASLEHPSIVPLYRFGIEDGVPWMALRYIAGGDLSRRLADRPLGTAEGFAILGDIARALEHAHKRGVIHRDLKPQNILLDEDDHAYLADFGVAKLLQSTALVRTGTGSTVGTPAYMAPEQALGNELTPASDLYALGVICFQWWTGILPFDADTPHAVLLKHAMEPLPAQPLESLSPSMRAVLTRALEKDPKARYPSATALVDALRDAQSMSSTATPPPVQGFAAPPPVPEEPIAPTAAQHRTPSTPPPALPPQPAVQITRPGPPKPAIPGTGASVALWWWMGGGAVVVLLGIVVLLAAWMARTATPAVPGHYEGFVMGKALGLDLHADGTGNARADGETDTPLAWTQPGSDPGYVVIDQEPGEPPIRLAIDSLVSGRYLSPTGMDHAPVVIRRAGTDNASWPQVSLLPTEWLASRVGITCDPGQSGVDGWLRFREDGRAKLRIGEDTHDVAWVADRDALGALVVRLSGEDVGATVSETRWATSESFSSGSCLGGAVSVDAPSS